MKKYIGLTLLLSLAMAGAIVEGLAENLAPQFVQMNGLLMLASALVLLGSALKIQAGAVSKI